MIGIRSDRMHRFGLAVVLLGMLICVGILVFSIPDIDRVELIPVDQKVVAIQDLPPGEERVQSVYLHEAFDRLTLFRSNADTKNVMGIEATLNGRLRFSEDLVFAAGETRREVHFSGEKGTLVLRIVNHEKVPLSLPLVSESAYNIGAGMEAADSLLRLGVDRRSDIAKWTFGAAALLLFLLALGVLWGWGTRWNRKKAVLFILMICLVYSLLFPAWNVNDFSMHFMTSWSYANTFLGIGPDETDLVMVREDDIEPFSFVLNDRYQSFFQPTSKSYDNAVSYLFQRTEHNQIVPFERDNSVRRENGIWSYFPYILGILIARLLSLNVVTAVFLARFCGLAFCISGICAALRILPERMTVPVTILSCVPVCAMNLVAVSYDGPCYVVVLCFFACIISLREQYSLRVALFLVFCSLALSLVKRGAYTPFILSLPVLLSSREKNRKNLVICCVFASVLGLLYNYRNILLGRISLNTFTSEGFGTLNAKWALQHPLNYLILMVRSYLRQTDKIYGVIGRHLGWNKAVIPEFVCGLFYLLLILSSVLPGSGFKEMKAFSRLEKTWIWLPVAALILLLPTTMLSYTFVTSEIIDGPQGRYYLPLLIPLLMLCCHNLRRKIILKADISTLLLWGASFLHLASVYYVAFGFLHG